MLVCIFPSAVASIFLSPFLSFPFLFFFNQILAIIEQDAAQAAIQEAARGEGRGMAAGAKQQSRALQSRAWKFRGFFKYIFFLLRFCFEIGA